MSKGDGRKPAKGSKSSPDKSERELVAARRTALKKLGLFGAAAAPAILAMTLSDKAAAIAVDSGGTG